MEPHFVDPYPKEYCCEELKEGVTEYGLFEYDKCYNQYSLCHDYHENDPYKGLLSFKWHAWARINYCPYCGQEIESLRELYSEKRKYYLEDKGWKEVEFLRYWKLYREELSDAQAEDTVEAERESPPF